jgi:hypothetical protein
MDAWMHQQAHRYIESTERMDANSGKPWSEMDITDLTYSLAHGNSFADVASMLCQDIAEVRKKAPGLEYVHGTDVHGTVQGFRRPGDVPWTPPAVIPSTSCPVCALAGGAARLRRGEPGTVPRPHTLMLLNRRRLLPLRASDGGRQASRRMIADSVSLRESRG